MVARIGLFVLAADLMFGAAMSQPPKADAAYWKCTIVIAWGKAVCGWYDPQSYPQCWSSTIGWYSC